MFNSLILIDTIWERITVHAGATFRTISGKPFTYGGGASSIQLGHTNQWLSRNRFEKALKRVPMENTRVVQDLRGPSFLYAILMDPRIRQSDWQAGKSKGITTQPSGIRENVERLPGGQKSVSAYQALRLLPAERRDRLTQERDRRGAASASVIHVITALPSLRAGIRVPDQQ
jgi:hypothetical protein